MGEMVLKNLKRPFKFRILYLRRFSQLGFLISFLWLFRGTEYSGQNQIGHTFTLFFQWNPLIVLAAILAAKSLIIQIIPALALLAAVAVLGRIICGWMCPLGSLLDGFHVLYRRRLSHRLPEWLSVKYGILVVILVGALCNIQLVGFFDPFALLARGLVCAVDPMFKYAVDTIFAVTYASAPHWISGLTEPFYAFLRAAILPFNQSYFYGAGISLVFLALIFVAETSDRRYWCKYLCPLGALQALTSRFSLLRRRPQRICSQCSTCMDDCRIRAFNAEGFALREECIRCFRCLDNCPKEIVSYKLGAPTKSPLPVSFSRRQFLAASASGITLALASKITPFTKVIPAFLLRPPGALDEDAFINACVRCGACMKVCPTNGLQPALVEFELKRLFSPRLIPRIGYCEFNCTLCSQVCPSGAIQRLQLKAKQNFIIGRARIDKNQCLPYAQKIPCIVCEEHCPVPKKAIALIKQTVVYEDGREVELKLPAVIDELCIGCGICETKCPVTGDSAIRVFAYRPANPYS